MRGPHLELWISLLTEGRHPRFRSEEMKSHSLMRVSCTRSSRWLRLRRSNFLTTGLLPKGEQEVFAVVWRGVQRGLKARSSGFHDIIKVFLN